MDRMSELAEVIRNALENHERVNEVEIRSECTNAVDLVVTTENGNRFLVTIMEEE